MSRDNCCHSALGLALLALFKTGATPSRTLVRTQLAEKQEWAEVPPPCGPFYGLRNILHQYCRRQNGAGYIPAHIAGEATQLMTVGVSFQDILVLIDNFACQFVCGLAS